MLSRAVVSDIRPAIQSDTVFLSVGLDALLAHVVDTSHDPYLTALEASGANVSRAYLSNLIAHPDKLCLIATEDSQPIGFIVGEITRPFAASEGIQDIGLISACWVQPQHRRNRTAQRLVTSLEEWFAERKLPYVDLNYVLGNYAADQFWAFMGYQPYRITSRKALG